MKIYCLIFIVSSNFFVGSCTQTLMHRAALEAKTENPQDRAMENKIKRIFRNITTLLHDSHPSVNGAIREITTCIAEEALDEAMEGLVIKSYHGLKNNENVKVRNKICKENKEVINSYIYCLINAQTEQFRDFLTALSLTSEFLIDEFCQSPDISRLPSFMAEQNFRELKAKLPQVFIKPLDQIEENESHPINPSEDDLCLPIRVAESMEVMAILSRKFPFYLHGSIGNLYHLITTISFNYPFKAYKKCA